MITEQKLFNERDKICKTIGATRIYTINDFRACFNISYPYVYKLLREDKIPPFRGKIGRYSFYTEVDIEEIKNSGILNHKLLERG